MAGSPRRPGAGQRPHYPFPARLRPGVGVPTRRSRSAITGWPDSARVSRTSRSRATVKMSISPAAVTITYPRPCRTPMARRSSMARSPPSARCRRGRAGQVRVRRGEPAGGSSQEGGYLADPGGDGLVPGPGRGQGGPSPQPLVAGAPPAGVADAGASAEDQRPVRAVAGDAGPEGDHGDLPAMPDGVGVSDAAVAGLAAQLPPSLLADRAAVPVVVQGVHHLPGPRPARYHLLGGAAVPAGQARGLVPAG